MSTGDPTRTTSTGNAGEVSYQRPRLLLVAEAAELLRLRESTLRDYSRRGIVPSVRIGRHVRYVEADLLAWLDGLRAGMEPA